MFGKIVDINNNCIKVVNLLNRAEIGLINFHVIFEDKTSRFVGVISSVNENYIFILLIGEIINSTFTPGIVKKPMYSSKCRLINKNELEYVLGNQNYSKRTNLLLGTSAIYDGFKVSINRDELLASHFAVFGNTGSGKSCAVTRMLQNIFYYNDGTIPRNAHVVLFDAFGEYDDAFHDINKIPGLGYRKYICSAAATLTNDEILKLPIYFLDVHDLALLLDVESIDLVPVIENTLRITYIFTSNDKKIVEYKNNIIARSLQDILASGKPATQIADQIIAILTKYNTSELNLNTIISQPGYDRTIRQCLNVNDQGKIPAMNLVVDFLTQYTTLDIDQITISSGFVYTLEDLYNALEFSLINEGILMSNTKYDKLNALKVRLRSIINSDIKRIFDYDGIVTKEEYIKKFFSMPDGGPCQLVDVNFDEVDERYAKTLTKIFSKLFFNHLTTLKNRAEFPIHIIIEEAHRYVQNDNDINIIGYNIFERIVKQGRKYGLILGFITQRPSELSSTVISQCSNYFVLRLYHPEDVDIIKEISTIVNDDMEDRIKLLRTGMAYCFGTAFKTTTLVQFQLPNPMPKSDSIKVTNIWYN